MRYNFKTDRNKALYEEYINTDASYSQLGHRYDLSPQRVQKIVADFKKSGLADTLNVGDPKNHREKVKNLAVELLVKGSITIAINKFLEVVEWDKHNDNVRGLDDTYGNIYGAFSGLASSANTKTKRNTYFDKAEEFLNYSKELANQGKLLEGAIIRNKVQQASFLAKKALFETEKASKTSLLTKALHKIDETIEPLSGSLFHKSWPSTIKVNILVGLERYSDAMETLKQIESYIFEGYFQEIEWPKYRVKRGEGLIGNNQASMKITKALAELTLTKAEISLKTQKYILAKHFAENVLGLSDPDGFLRNTKQKARAVLKEL